MVRTDFAPTNVQTLREYVNPRFVVTRVLLRTCRTDWVSCRPSLLGNDIVPEPARRLFRPFVYVTAVHRNQTTDDTFRRRFARYVCRTTQPFRSPIVTVFRLRYNCTERSKPADCRNRANPIDDGQRLNRIRR